MSSTSFDLLCIRGQQVMQQAQAVYKVYYASLQYSHVTLRTVMKRPGPFKAKRFLCLLLSSVFKKLASHILTNLHTQFFYIKIILSLSLFSVLIFTRLQPEAQKIFRLHATLVM